MISQSLPNAGLKTNLMAQPKVALITGAARRIGAAIADFLHQKGYCIVIHYHQSEQAARQEEERLNLIRPNSVHCVQADLSSFESYELVIAKTLSFWQRLDVLIHNASKFYPTPIGSISEAAWQDLITSNVQAPLFLSQAAIPYLSQTGGNIVAITDAQLLRPHFGYAAYAIAKAGLTEMVYALAKEVGPIVRVNAVAPGAILDPEHSKSMLTTSQKYEYFAHTALKRQGTPLEIAEAVYFVLQNSYITGQVIAVDGGRGLF